jgi:hypothetical protein
LGEVEVYLQDKELERITDMILGRDGKIYAVQAPLLNDYDSSLIVYPKRVISIKNGVIKTEVEFPSDVNTHYWKWGECGTWNEQFSICGRPPYWWREAKAVEKLKIIENSDLGKEKFGTEFYVSDFLEGVIYKVDVGKKVSVIAKGLRYPTSLSVDSLGDVFYTTTPIFGRWHDPLLYQSSLYALNPETGISILIYNFQESADVYWAAGTAYAMKNYDTGERYTLIPASYNVTNILYESKDKLDFIISNSHQGTLKLVSVEKSSID